MEVSNYIRESEERRERQMAKSQDGQVTGVQ
jgi:hypothetical protein